MPYEADLIRRLGFEVFTPKIIPASGFRSGAVTHEFDATLSIPPRALSRLNAVNFYEGQWSPQTVKLLNRYFKTLFVMPHGECLREAVEKFDGRIVLRAFGLDSDTTYADVIERLHSPRTLRKIEALGDRFVFGEGYDNLHLIEPHPIASRAVHLPLGAPLGLLAQQPTWANIDRRILLSCPSIGVDAYYARVYGEFRSQFGDLPYVVSGVQEQRIEDDNVLGFVDDEDLSRLYSTCSVLYYPSREPRHVHYTPVEAAAAGQPIVFYRGSLLDHLTGGDARGGVDTPTEARALIERLLAGDRDLATELVESQRRLRHRFDDQFCLETWQRSFDELDIGITEPATRVRHVVRELGRSVLLPAAHGRASIRPVTPPPIPRATLPEHEYFAEHGTSLRDGLDLAQPTAPSFVAALDGFGQAEPGGRWIVEPNAEIVLRHTLPSSFRLAIEAFPAPGVDAALVEVRVGRRSRQLAIDVRTPGTSATRLLEFERVARGRDTIHISPCATPSARQIGVTRVRMLPEVTPFPRSGDTPGAVLGRIDFSDPDMSGLVDATVGLSGWEGWGRWTDGRRVRFELAHSVVGRVTLGVRASAYGPNVDRPVVAAIGAARAVLAFPAGIPDSAVCVDLEVVEASNVITLEIPHPAPTPDDPRLLGVGVAEIVLLVASTTS